MTVWILVMHLLMADGSDLAQQVEVQAATIEQCLDIGKERINAWHAEKPDSVSGLHFCIKKDWKP